MMNRFGVKPLRASAYNKHLSVSDRAEMFRDAIRNFSESRGSQAMLRQRRADAKRGQYDEPSEFPLRGTPFRRVV